MPIPRETLEIHEAGLRRKALERGLDYGPDLAIESVYEHSEALGQLLSDGWFRQRFAE